MSYMPIRSIWLRVHLGLQHLYWIFCLIFAPLNSLLRKDFLNLHVEIFSYNWILVYFSFFSMHLKICSNLFRLVMFSWLIDSFIMSWHPFLLTFLIPKLFKIIIFLNGVYFCIFLLLTYLYLDILFTFYEENM